MAAMTGYQFLISAVPTLNRFSGSAGQRVLVALLHGGHDRLIEILVDHEVRQAAGRDQRHAVEPLEARDRAIQRTSKLEASAQLWRVVGEMDVQDDGHARRRPVLQDRVIEEAVGVRDPAARRAAWRVVGLRQVEVLVAQRVEDVVGERGRAGVRGALGGRITRLGDVQAGLVLVQVLDVSNLAAAIHRDRGRQARVEELALIVAEDDDGIRGDLVEFLPERSPWRAGIWRSARA